MKKKMLVLGSRESFLIRAMIKKTTDVGIDSSFIAWDEDAINRINARWEDVSLVTCYLDNNERIPGDVLRFLADKIVDDCGHMILVGDPSDTVPLCDIIPGDVIYKMFKRPLDNEEYLETVRELFDKIGSGDFKQNILVVDDDPTYLMLVREWLKGTYKVAMANSGLQAIKWLGKNKADLILLDYEMPVTSGPQVLEMLRSDPDTKLIPVIFLTGHGDKESVMSVVALKPEGYFLKNIEREELLTKLQEFFASRK